MAEAPGAAISAVPWCSRCWGWDTRPALTFHLDDPSKLLRDRQHSLNNGRVNCWLSFLGDYHHD